MPTHSTTTSYSFRVASPAVAWVSVAPNASAVSRRSRHGVDGGDPPGSALARPGDRREPDRPRTDDRGPCRPGQSVRCGHNGGPPHTARRGPRAGDRPESEPRTTRPLAPTVSSAKPPAPPPSPMRPAAGQCATSPVRHHTQLPQDATGRTATCTPWRQPSTPGPTSTTCPPKSWPMMVPTGSEPRALRSEPHRPQAVTRTSNSPACGTGSVTEARSKAPPSRTSAARMSLSNGRHQRSIPLDDCGNLC